MANHTISGTTSSGKYFGNITVTQGTMDKIEAAEAKGATIVVNADYMFQGKRSQRVEKLAQTNSRNSGRYVNHIVWAVFGESGSQASN